MRCATCGTQWDHDDKDPPACIAPAVKVLRQEVAEARLTAAAEAARGATEAIVPLELPEDLARRMATAYEAVVLHGEVGASCVPAMRAAWRVFLDEGL